MILPIDVGNWEFWMSDSTDEDTGTYVCKFCRTRVRTSPGKLPKKCLRCGKEMLHPHTYVKVSASIYSDGKNLNAPDVADELIEWAEGKGYLILGSFVTEKDEEEDDG